MAQKTEKEETTDLKIAPEPPPQPLTFSAAVSSSRSADRTPILFQTRDRSRNQGRIVTVDDDEEVVVVVREVKRCAGCRRKVGLTGFRCRCGDLFCGVHRYSDRHECGFNYKAAGREVIERENPVVKAAKIVKV